MVADTTDIIIIIGTTIAMDIMDKNIAQLAVERLHFVKEIFNLANSYLM